jgi:hypothetical protein
VGALLGPEGTGFACFFSGSVSVIPLRVVVVGGLVVLVLGLLFEICIVDASIFIFVVCV